MKIMLAMATYNRKSVLNQCILSLSKLKDLSRVDLFIFDDKSTEYDFDYLSKIIPFAKEIIVREKNLKADKNMYQMYLDFLKRDYDYLLQVDSDMLFHQDFFQLVEKIASFSGSDKVYSFYNSNNHKFLFDKPNTNIEGVIFGNKEDIGGACVLFHRKAVEIIVENLQIINESDFVNYDYRWSKCLIKNGFSILVSEISYLQHIGFIGQNNDGIKGLDIGYNFTPTNNEDRDFLFRQYENIISNYTKFAQENIFINRRKIPKIFWFMWNAIKYLKGKIVK